MRKSTKIVAVLGIAAGLGIASLPLGTFAEESKSILPLNYDKPKESTDVKVGINVDSAITIASDTDRCVKEGVKVYSVGSCSHKIAGGSNNQYGFTITVADKDSELALVNSNGSTKNTARVEAKDGALKAGDGAWNISGGLLENKAIKETNQDVLKTDKSGEVETDMTYNFATQRNQERGSYEDTIVYTISDNSGSGMDASVDPWEEGEDLDTPVM